jgi:4'-phosphopantetheinyl transferase
MLMPASSPWRHPPARPSLAGDEVHLWSVPLRQAAATTQSCFSVLTPDERRRSERFLFRADRTRFAVARGMLRIIIGRYLRINPARLRFDYNAYGKPALAGDGAAETLRFNLSHSNDLALYAFTQAREVGVDLEYLRPDFASEQLAGRFFSAAEIEVLRVLPARQQTESFFNCWTRKEAYVKARGEGLALSLHDFDVSFMPGDPARLLCVRGESGGAQRWSLRALTPETGYVAALAVEGHDWRLKCWRWAG